MAQLELLASPPGTGKTTYCIEAFKKEILKSSKGLDGRSFFVLPSREHADRIENLILRVSVPGLFNTHILTINDLAARLADTPGGCEASDVFKRQILREILEGTDTWKYFASASRLVGFHELCLELIQEFKAGLLTLAEFEKRAQPLLKSPVFRAKFRDLCVLIKKYDERLLEAGYTSGEDVIVRLLEHPKKALLLDLVVLDGFYHFSRAQMEMIRALTRCSKRLVVTLTMGQKPGERPDLFYHALRTEKLLLDLGFRRATGALDRNRHRGRPELAHLEREIFSPSPLLFSGAVENLGIFEAPSVQGEIEMIARKVRALCRDEGLYFSDVCVILRSVSGYQRIILSVFKRYGIPVHVHERYRLIENPVGAWLYRFINLITLQWPREDLFYLLKSTTHGTSLSIEDTLRFEKKAASLGVLTGRDAWFGLLEAPGTPQAVAGQIRTLDSYGRSLLDSKSIRALTANLRRILTHLAVSNPLTTPSVENILRAMDRSEPKNGNGSFNALAALGAFQTLVDSALYSEKPRGKNRVQVYDVVMALPKEYKVVFIAGLVERGFPQAVLEEPILKDEERRIINQKGTVLEERASRAAGERYFFYMALTRAREKVYFSYPLYDSTGRPLLPSFFVEEAEKCFSTGIPKKSRSLADFLPGPEDWEEEAEVARGLADILGRQEAPSTDKALSEVLNVWKNRKDFMEILRWKNRPELHAQIEDPRIQALILKEQNVFSATRLEIMATCAFRYFASEVLSLKETPKALEAMEMGTLLHKTLELFFKSLTAKARKTGSYLSNPEETQKKLIEILDPMLRQSLLARGKKYRFYIQRQTLERALSLFVETEKELFEKRELRPGEFELKFGYKEKDSLPFLTLGSGKNTVAIRGQLDRVDMSDDGRKALVTDYKSSKRSSLHEKVEKGLELQLPIYLLVVRRLLQLEVVGAEHRYLRQAARQGIYRAQARSLLGLTQRSRLYTEEEFEHVLESTERLVLDLVGRIRSSDIRVRSKSCEFCGFAAVCRFEPWKLIYEKATHGDKTLE